MTNLLPPSWSSLSLEQLAAPGAPIIYGILQPGPIVPGGIPYVRPTEIQGDVIQLDEIRTTTPEIAAQYPRSVLKSGDILLSIVGTVGKVAEVPPELEGGNITQSSVRVRPNLEIVNRSFLAWFLRAPAAREQYGRQMLGTGVPRLNVAHVRALDVVVPPVNEQKRIVAKIEELTARSRRAKEALDAVPPLLDKLRQSILAAAFRGDLTADWRAKNPNVEPADQLLARIRTERRARWEAAELAKMQAKGKTPRDDAWKKKYEEPTLDISELPKLPSGWCWAPLPTLGELARGKSKHRPRNDPALFGDVMPFIQTGDVARSGGHISTYSSMYSDLGVRQSRVFPKGTLCITIAANIADTGILGFDSCFPDSVVGFQADGGVLVASFVEFYIRTIRLDLLRFAPATAQANINLEVLHSVAVPVPPCEELALLVARVQDATSRIDACESLARDIRATSEFLDQSILAKAFRGELVPQDPTDEPASVLLDRIRAARETPTSKPTKPRRARKASAEAPAPKPAQLPLDLTPATIESEVFPALWPRGPLDKDTATRTLAEHLRERRLVDFKRLRADGPLYKQLLAAIESAVKSGQLDRPRRGHVRAYKHEATAYTRDDWRLVLVASLGAEPIHQEDAIRQAAEWARDNLGLEFSRLPADGHIATGLRSAITSAIRQGLLERDGPKRIVLADG